MTATFLVGDIHQRQTELIEAGEQFDLIITSPPFLALRSYLPDDHPDKAKEIGSEATPAEYLDVLLTLTAQWRQLLAPHGSIAIEIGDTYAGSGGAGGDYNENGLRAGQPKFRTDWSRSGLLAQSLTGIPTLYTWSLAYGRNLLTGQPSPAGQWMIRNLKPWIRTNPPVGALGKKERPATSYITVAALARDRWFDLDSVRTAVLDPDRKGGAPRGRIHRGGPGGDGDTTNYEDRDRLSNPAGAPPLDWVIDVDLIIDNELRQRAGKPNDGGPGRGNRAGGLNGRLGQDRKGERFTDGGASVGARGYHIRRALERAGILTTQDALDISPRGYTGAHYAVWPPELVKQLVLEMCPPDGTVLDPFVGSGTTLMVCSGLGRKSVGIDLDARNAHLAEQRCGMFLEVDWGQLEPTSELPPDEIVAAVNEELL